MSKNFEVFIRAKKYLPGGVNSPVRSFKSVGGEPIIVERGKGAFIYDVEGNQYIDFVMSWGPLILGHANEEVLCNLIETALKGTSFGFTNPLEIELAEEVVNAFPSIEKVRFVNSGTEAVMSAIRLARAYTNRPYIVKFEGCYHGYYDSVLVSAGSGVATHSLIGTNGIPKEMENLTITLPYNNEEKVKEVFEKMGEEIACVIVEPIAGNMGVIPPKESFLKTLRELTQRYGALLIFDEVITGFRISLGGAQEYYNIQPDLTTLGKILGGGMPIGAFGGKKEIMENIAPEGEVYQAGTLSGNPVAMAAGLSTVRILKRIRPYSELDKRSRYFTEKVSQILKEKGIVHTYNRVGSMFTFFFTEEPVTNYEQAKKADTRLFAKFFKALLRNGVLIPPSQFEAWFLSTSHSPEILNQALEKIEKAVKEL